MKQEDKDLMLRYLSMALPYGVVIQITSDGGMSEVSYNIRLDVELLADLLYTEDDFKPYLRPLSSMTKEEREQFLDELDGYGFLSMLTMFDGSVRLIVDRGSEYDLEFDLTELINAINFLLRNHFDIFGFIPKGLAIEVTESNNPYKD